MRQMKQKKDTKKRPRRADWVENQLKIEKAFQALSTKHGRIPTERELCEEAGISRATLHRHERDPQKYQQMLRSVIRRNGWRIVMAMIFGAQKGNERLIRMCFEYGFDMNLLSEEAEEAKKGMVAMLADIAKYEKDQKQITAGTGDPRKDTTGSPTIPSPNGDKVLGQAKRDNKQRTG